MNGMPILPIVYQVLFLMQFFLQSGQYFLIILIVILYLSLSSNSGQLLEVVPVEVHLNFVVPHFAVQLPIGLLKKFELLISCSQTPQNFLLFFFESKDIMQEFTGC